MANNNTAPQYHPPAAPLPPVPLAESRERAIKLLSDGYAYDRLSESEFEARLGRLSNAQSPAAADALVADLLAPAPAPAPVATGLATDERRILAVMSNSRHEGVWMVPPKLAVAAVMSDVRLDLRYAILPATCTIEVNAFMTNVTLIVPVGLPVYFDVNPLMSSTRNDAAPTRPPVPGLPVIMVNGFAFMSEVRVKVQGPGR